MLASLHIANYVLIDWLDIDFAPHFSVITGETGAGKSILLGALGLLVGGRADTSAIAPGTDRCIVEGRFTGFVPEMKAVLDRYDLDFDPDECTIRREISSKGKSRAFVNDTPAPLTALRELADFLIDIHSQHKNLLLGDSLFQLNVLDAYSGKPDLYAHYSKAYRVYAERKQKLEDLRKAAAATASEYDYWQFRFEQLDKAGLESGEEARLQEEQAMLTHALDIKRELGHSYSLLSDDERGLLSGLNKVEDALATIESYYPDSASFRQRIRDVRIELADIASDLGRRSDDVSYEPERLNAVTDRLDEILSLLHRYNADSSDALIAIRDDLAERLSRISTDEEEISRLEQEVLAFYKEIEAQASLLTEERIRAASALETSLCESLRKLNMPHVRFVVDIRSTEYGPHGADKVVFLFSANKQMEPEPVSEIASGGEIARLMLCLKALIADKRSLPAIVFDEIDTGVSGEVADRMGEIMAHMGQGMQVLAITHLPQIAARGERHYFVYKDETGERARTFIRELTPEERIREIARMQSGNNLTDVALAAAKELLAR